MSRRTFLDLTIAAVSTLILMHLLNVILKNWICNLYVERRDSYQCIKSTILYIYENFIPSNKWASVWVQIYEGLVYLTIILLFLYFILRPYIKISLGAKNITNVRKNNFSRFYGSFVCIIVAISILYNLSVKSSFSMHRMHAIYHQKKFGNIWFVGNFCKLIYQKGCL